MSIVFLNNTDEAALTTSISLVKNIEVLQRKVSDVFTQEDISFNSISEIESELIKILLNSLGLNDLGDNDENNNTFYGYYRCPNEKTIWKNKKYDSASLYIINEDNPERESKLYKLLSDGGTHLILDSVDDENDYSHLSLFYS